MREDNGPAIPTGASAVAVERPSVSSVTPSLAARPLRGLETDRLTLEIAGTRRVDEVTFTLAPASLTMVMGANGAGKSLLLRLLHGLLSPSSGTIHWNGEAMSDAVRRRQAMVFQRPVLLRRSVAANLRFAFDTIKPRLSRSEASDQIAELLRHVGLLDRAKQPARLLSGGEQQRLALARALATRPQTLFLDEPTASLDPAATHHIEEIVRHAHDAGTKIVFVTHDVGQARRLADDIVFLHKGTLAEHAPADAFFSAPQTRPAQAYLKGELLP